METPHDSEPSVRIGMRDMFDEMRAMRSLLERLVQVGESQGQEIAKQGLKLEALEEKVQQQADRFARWRYMLTSGVLTGGVSLATVLARVLLK